MHGIYLNLMHFIFQKNISKCDILHFIYWCRNTAYHINFITITRWGRVTHICVSKLTFIGANKGLPPGRRQAIIWTIAGILLIRTLRINFSEILSEIHAFSFKKMHLKIWCAKWRQLCFGLNVLTIIFANPGQFGNDCRKWDAIIYSSHVNSHIFMEILRTRSFSINIFLIMNTKWYLIII